LKPSIPKGTRDFSPQEMVKRNYIFDTIRQVFRNYGYLPIETPSMENLDTLMGKYGEEGDKLIFKILNSGDFLDGVKDKDVKAMTSKEATKYISEKALRYDLTVPFARYVVQHQNDITFPFKRYQIQPVWRADRPQKGRYREFYQCDVDVIGSNSLLNEVELIQIIDDVFTKLGVPVIVKLNNRKILQGIAEAIGEPDKMIDIAIVIDKLDKVGEDGVRKELIDKGFDNGKVDKLLKIILDKTIVSIRDSRMEITHNINESDSRLAVLATKFNEDGTFLVPEVFVKGKDELGQVVYKVKKLINSTKIEVDLSLARGLNYYTGSIIEVQVDRDRCKSEFTSSICGGGRYDDLTGIFGLPNISGVGVSFGADRIYDVMEELGKFPEGVTGSTKVMFVNFGEKEAQYCLPMVADLRKNNISAELYPDAAKFKKQMGYADDKKIAYVVFVGADEMQKGVLKLKNMISGEEKEIKSDELIKHIV
jgi:histidyl-tRNA synthetase